MEEKIASLQIEDGLFEAGKIHSSFVTNLTTLLLHIQTPELFEAFCQDEQDSTIIKETLSILVNDWQEKLKQQGLAKTIYLDPKSLGDVQ